MLPALAALTMLTTPDHRPLLDYLATRQRGLPEAKMTKQNGMIEIEFCSQIWQKQLWSHRILLLVPKGAESSKTALLYITGDGPRKGDYVDLNLLAGATKMPIAMLFSIPNQPIWDMKEDDLIAHTFTKYIETGDESWPLLFPMTKAAVSSMDVVQRFGKQNGMDFRRFVVTGASKRGWTTWLTAASGDRRIAGIAPMVFDNLKFDAQMKHQLELWGAYSAQIEDYTKRGLQAKLATPEGEKLMKMVDPYSYLDRIKVPTLVVNGANDDYWATDAQKIYWSDMKQPKNLLMVPNSGHGLEDRARVVNSIGAFARSLNGDFKFPEFRAKANVTEDDVTFNLEGATPTAVSAWVNESDTQDFRPGRWVEKKLGSGALRVELARGKWSAVFLEGKFNEAGRTFTLSTPVEIAFGGKPPKK